MSFPSFQIENRNLIMNAELQGKATIIAWNSCFVISFYLLFTFYTLFNWINCFTMFKSLSWITNSSILVGVRNFKEIYQIWKIDVFGFPKELFWWTTYKWIIIPSKNQPCCKISAICPVFIFEINIKLFYEKNILKAKIVVFSVAFNVIQGWYFIIQKRSPGTFLSKARLIMTCFFIQRHLGHTFWLFALLENFFDQIL